MTQNDDRGLQSVALATKTATHLAKTTPKYWACHTKRLSTRYQTGWKATKCRACHAKRHDNLLENLRKGGFVTSPIDTARPQENQRRVGAAKRAFRVRLPLILTLCSFKIDVFLQVFLGTSKFATSKTMFRARHPSQFSAHLTKCHACHGIYTLSPLDAALPMRFA